ncbi:SsgA family sporulation/cell division regulator [Streptomyces sp. NPDC017941]|uniref:SsgA family sporulation/cell division regulator n=1 Tax=unclassified Streptomyces TaxID=2593676 RepID=UPI0037A62B9E
MSAVEQYTRAHLVTDSPDEHVVVPVALRYDPEADPQAVRVGLPGNQGSHWAGLPGGAEWVVARDLLERGLRTPARGGDVTVWPCGRVQAVLEFHSAAGVAVMQFDSSALIRFLRRTRTAATAPVGH